MVDGQPQPPTFTLTWLSPDSVKDWLRLPADDTVDDDLIVQCCALTEIHVQDVRSDAIGEDGNYLPDAEIYQGAVMYAAREFRRRNSPAGIEVLGDQTSFVSRYDADIDRALHTGPWAPSVAV